MKGSDGPQGLPGMEGPLGPKGSDGPTGIKVHRYFSVKKFFALLIHNCI